MNLQHTRPFQVATYHVGPGGKARPSALMGFLEETAGEHAITWNLGLPDLLPKGLTWVISRYHLRLLQCPKYGDNLQVTTWPSGRGSLFATRDFELKDSSGTPVALATTSWAILDINAKKPVPISSVVPPGFVVEQRALQDSFRPLPQLETSERDITLPVMLRDLDLNGHVNHIVYVQWAMETIPLEVLKKSSPISIEVAYRAEARLGDTIVSSICTMPSETDRVFIHRIKHAETGVEMARLRTTWPA